MRYVSRPSNRPSCRVGPAASRPALRRWQAALVASVSGVLMLPAALPDMAAAAAPSPAERPSSSAAPSAAADRQKAKPRFPGHRPGRIYLGMSCGESCAQKEAQLGVGTGMKRWFKHWGNWDGVADAIREDRRKHRLSWISIEGPHDGTPTGWREVGQGDHDRDIRQLAKVLKRFDDKPIYLSFGHEVSNNVPDSQGAWWARGFTRFHDVLQRAHALKRVALAPIFVSWFFDKDNHENDPAKWLPPRVLKRTSFMGVDLYQNDSGKAFGQRLPQVSGWLARNGHPRMMVGLGETGGTNAFGNVSGAAWLNKSLRWAAQHRGQVAAISYFNSTANSDPNVYWPLDESARKMAVYRKWLRDPRFVSRVG